MQDIVKIQKNQLDGLVIIRKTRNYFLRVDDI